MMGTYYCLGCNEIVDIREPYHKSCLALGMIVIKEKSNS